MNVMKLLFISTWLPFLVMGALQTEGGIRLDFTVYRGNDMNDMEVGKQAGLRKRDDSFAMSIDNEKTFYMVELKIGSDKQKNSVLVDTGSSDLWVMSSDVTCDISSTGNTKGAKVENRTEFLQKIDQNKKRLEATPTTIESATIINEKNLVTTIYISDAAVYESLLSEYYGGGIGGFGGSETASGEIAPAISGTACTAYGSFNTDSSDTFHKNSSANEFTITYGDNSGAIGTWGYDDVIIGNITVSDLSFAVANYTSSTIGVLGIGLPGLESTYSTSNGGNYQYENLPIKLKVEGHIEKSSYSIYLGDTDSSSGTILFGAVDSAKYSGELETVPIINTYADMGYNEPIRLDIVLSSISFNSSGSQTTITNNSYAATLDTGSTLSYFTTSLLEKIAETLGASYDSSIGYYEVPCTSDQHYAIVFGFSGAYISVPYDDMLLEYGNTCYLGMASSDSNILGDNFLRSAYVVVNLDDYEISLAQVKYTDSEDIKVISSSVPNAVKAADYSSTSLDSSVSEGSGTAISYSTGSSSGDSSKSNQAHTQTSVSTILILAIASISLVILA